MPLNVVRARSVREAAAMLAENSGARFIGGGTLAVRDVNGGDVSIDTLILPDDLDLGDVSIANGEAAVGAGVSMADLQRHSGLSFLRPVAQSIGGPAVRAMATVGGNLFAPYPYGDFTVALLALGAKVSLEGAGGPESVELGAFLADRGRHARAIVRGVSFALPPSGAFRYAKAVRRKPHGASVLSIAAVIAMNGGEVGRAWVAYGAMAPTPMRARAVERALKGRPLDAAAIDAAVRVATEGCHPLSDPQASDWYRMAVLPAHLARLLRGDSGEATH